MRIVIAEDSLLLREGIVRLLAEIGHDVVAQTGDAPGLVRVCGMHEPDLAIVDVRMPPTFTDDGLRAALEVRKRWPSIGIVVLSQYIEADYARRLVEDGRGGIGYLLKDRVQDLTGFAEAISQVGAGGIVLDPKVVAQLVVRRSPDSPIERLTPREREVLGLIAQGRSNRAIAAELHLSLGAIEKNISAIFMKLDLADSPQDHRRVLAALAWLDTISHI